MLTSPNHSQHIQIQYNTYPGSRCSLQAKLRGGGREGRASGHIGCKSHFHTWLGSEFVSRISGTLMPGSQFVYLVKIDKKISMALIITIQVLYDLSKEFVKVYLLFFVMATIMWCIFRKTTQKNKSFIQRLCSSIFCDWEDAELRLSFTHNITVYWMNRKSSHLGFIYAAILRWSASNKC
jgi:hypothetical protein